MPTGGRFDKMVIEIRQEKYVWYSNLTLLVLLETIAIFNNNNYIGFFHHGILPIYEQIQVWSLNGITDFNFDVTCIIENLMALY